MQFAVLSCDNSVATVHPVPTLLEVEASLLPHLLCVQFPVLSCDNSVAIVHPVPTLLEEEASYPICYVYDILSCPVTTL